LRLLRGIVLGLGGVEALLILGGIAVLLSGNADPLGANIAQGIAAIMLIPLVACVLPALVLGWFRRWLPLALMLEIGWPLAVLVISRLES
jgi:hypothetical protein